MQESNFGSLVVILSGTWWIVGMRSRSLISVVIGTGSIVASGNSRSTGSTGSMMTSSDGAAETAEGPDEAEGCAWVSTASGRASATAAPEEAAEGRKSISMEEVCLV